MRSPHFSNGTPNNQYDGRGSACAHVQLRFHISHGLITRPPAACTKIIWRHPNPPVPRMGSYLEIESLMRQSSQNTLFSTDATPKWLLLVYKGGMVTQRRVHREENVGGKQKTTNGRGWHCKGLRERPGTDSSLTHLRRPTTWPTTLDLDFKPPELWDSTFLSGSPVCGTL